ncbi:hypothetical protein MBLNU459_g3038t1 [Dothideomycetes sp. NU459]
MSDSINHATLGKVQGQTKGDVTQFLGIKYAHLKDRFAEPVLADYATDSTIDATKAGPAVLSPPGAVAMEHHLIQHTLPYGEMPISDIEGLNLSISVPTSALNSKQKLPVYVFIHGGGFNIGASTWPQYDNAKLVQLSIKHGSPVIGVGINYRLGAPGFLTSEDLRNAGYKANNGLRDQRTALEWIQKHISGFGGDPDNVTVAGESAGGVSVTHMLQSQKPLFKRAVPMSGSALLMGPVPLQVSESFYQTAIKLLDLESASPSERVKALTTMPGMEMLQKFGQSVHASTAIDDEILFGAPSFAAIMEGKESYPLPGASWCESVMIGDCAFDGSITSFFIGHRKPGIGATFTKHVQATLPSEAAARLLKVYDITPDSPDDTAFLNVLHFNNDMQFYATTIAYATATSSKGTSTYVYRFNETNPWDGPWKGQSNHIIDVAFLFQNFNEFLDESRKGAAVKFGELFIDFVNGKAPWDAWSVGNEKAMVLEDGKTKVVKDVPEETGRRAEFLKLAQDVGFDTVNNVWTSFLHG